MGVSSLNGFDANCMAAFAVAGKVDSFAAMLSTVISLWCVQIPISVFLSYKLGVSGIWLGIPAGWISGFVIRFLYYKLWDCSKRH